MESATRKPTVHPRWGAALIIGLLLLSSLTRSQIVPRFIGAMIPVYYCILVSAILLQKRRFSFKAPTPLIVGIGGLFLMFVLHVSTGNFGSLTLAIWPYYTMVVATFALFVVPSIINQETTEWAISRIAIVFGIIGVITVFAPAVASPFFSISTTEWVYPAKTPPYLPAEGALQSVLANPNFAGTLFFVGSITALHDFYEKRTKLSLSILGFLIFCLFLTQSRGSMLAFATGTGFYLLYKFNGRKFIGPAIVLMVVFSTIFVLSRAMILPSLPLLEQVPLSTREIQWRGAIDATLHSGPLVGVGVYNTAEVAGEFYIDKELSQVVHSTHLQFLLRTGFVGFLLWMVSLFGSLYQHIVTHKEINIVPLAVVLGFSVLMIFETILPFNTRLSALLFCLSLGYLFVDHNKIYYIILSKGRKVT